MRSENPIMNPKTLVVVGCQWGDEGKGKIVDFLAKDFDIVMRYNGGNNAGHTVVIGDEKHKFHLLPSGSLQEKRIVMGNGMVVDPGVLLGEIATLRSKGIEPKLTISDRAHVIMPYHKIFDVSREKNNAGVKIGTTGRGIGPAYADKVRRTEAIRICDLVGDGLSEKIERIVKLKKSELMEHGAINGDSDEEAKDYAAGIADEYRKYADEIRPYVTDTIFMINQEMKKGSRILFEGAQGMLLDVDHGTYPYVTSSNVVSGGVCTGAGVSPRHIGKVIGVAKAYTTRVGEGPFPTELKGKTGDMIREVGKEYGTTTGRPRRCGWLDLVILKHACMVNGLEGIAVTKLDVMSGIEGIKVCMAYGIDGKTSDRFPSSIKDLENARPVYKDLPGWKRFDEGEKPDMVRRGIDGLPENAIKYVKLIEEETGVPVDIVSIGPARRETIVFKQ